MLHSSLAAILVLAINSQGAALFRTALAGEWAGTLEYRDYRSDRRVTLPTLLTVTPGAEATLDLAYVYDDGPGKTVRSNERVTMDAERGTYRIQNGDGTYDATFAAEGLREFGPAANVIVLMGKGTENDQEVELRITITVTPETFTTLRESRRSGGDWLFRNRYQLARRQ